MVLFVVFVFFNLFIFILFLAVLGLRFCARALSSCDKRGPLFIAVRRLLTAAASPVAGHRLQTHRLSNCGPRAQLLRGMWDLPRPGLEPVSPAMAGRFLTTVPPGKPHGALCYISLFSFLHSTYHYWKLTWLFIGLFIYLLFPHYSMCHYWPADRIMPSVTGWTEKWRIQQFEWVSCFFLLLSGVVC